MIGVIGGSGLYKMKGLKNVEEKEIATPFGEPSAPVAIGTLEGKKIAFLARHGKNHSHSPSTLNYRANVYAMKKIGVDRIIAAAAVGSLKEELKPGEIVMPDQIFDKTARKNTFFDEGIVAHVSLADPFCRELSGIMHKSAGEERVKAYLGGTYVCMEGPQFSTRAESEFHRKMGFDVIGMTGATEAKLAREAEICYTTLATVTDYDVWRETDVTLDMILDTLKKNTENVEKIIKNAVGKIAEKRTCACKDALANAIVTQDIAPAVKDKMGLLIGRYVK